MDMHRKIMGRMACVHASLLRMRHAALRKLGGEGGQATTEYAILVGVLVVIAVLAITLFKPKIEELWGTIADSINSL